MSDGAHGPESVQTRQGDGASQGVSLVWENSGQSLRKDPKDPCHLFTWLHSIESWRNSPRKSIPRAAPPGAAAEPLGCESLGELRAAGRGPGHLSSFRHESDTNHQVSLQKPFLTSKVPPPTLRLLGAEALPGGSLPLAAGAARWRSWCPVQRHRSQKEPERGPGWHLLGGTLGATEPTGTTVVLPGAPRSLQPVPRGEGGAGGGHGRLRNPRDMPQRVPCPAPRAESPSQRQLITQHQPRFIYMCTAYELGNDLAAGINPSI